jgi:UDP-glucose 4-epimerase
LALACWRQERLPVVIGRLFNVVGPRQTGRYGMVVPRFVTQALRGEPMTVYGDGRQTRCFTHVSDAVRGMISLMDSPDTVGEVFNIGSEEEVEIGVLAKMIRELIGSDSEIQYVPFEQAYGEDFEDMPRRVPSLEKIRAIVGFDPTIGLEDTLKSIIEYHKSEEVGSRWAARSKSALY